VLCVRVAYLNTLNEELLVFEKIINHFETHANLARALGVSRVAVTLWGMQGIPPQRAIDIERITGGKFKAIDIEGVRNEK